MVCSDPPRMARIYSAPYMANARAIFLFRQPRTGLLPQRIPSQPELLRQVFSGMDG